MSGTGIGSGARCPMSGTDRAYGRHIRYWHSVYGCWHSVYGCCAVSGTDIACATQCPVLTSRMPRWLLRDLRY
eukprot:3442508-Rhodomonas_salina.2